MANKQKLVRSIENRRKNEQKLYDQFEYSDSDTSFDNLQKNITAIAKREQPEVDQDPVDIPVSKKMQKIPMVWLSKCPLEKINHNMQVINQSSKLDECLTVFPLKLTSVAKFQNEKERLLYQQRVEVAKYFCERQLKKFNFKQSVDLNQPNSQIFKEKQKDPPKNFTTTLQTILVQTCRNLQQFILESLKIKIVHLSRLEYREIFSLLSSLIKFFNQDFCQTFISFIKYTFHFGEVNITRKQQIIRLYKSIQLAVKLRVEQRLNAINKAKGGNVQLYSFRQLTIKTKLKSIWNYQYQKFLLEAYQHDQHFGHIREEFQLKYPEHSGIFAANQIKDRLCSIIRRALRIIRQSISQYGKKQQDVPKLFGLNEKNFKIIMKSKNGVGIRLWLIDIYKRQHCQKEELINIVNVMNHFVEQKNLSRCTSSIGPSIAGDTDQNLENQDKQDSSSHMNLKEQQNKESKGNDFYFEESEQQKDHRVKSNKKRNNSSKNISEQEDKNQNSYYDESYSDREQQSCRV